MDYSPPGSSVHDISQARILEWLSFPSPEYLPHSGNKPLSPALAGRFFDAKPPGKHSLSRYIYIYNENNDSLIF